jgi:hypothetical protein
MAAAWVAAAWVTLPPFYPALDTWPGFRRAWNFPCTFPSKIFFGGKTAGYNTFARARRRRGGYSVSFPSSESLNASCSSDVTRHHGPPIIATWSAWPRGSRPPAAHRVKTNLSRAASTKPPLNQSSTALLYAQQGPSQPQACPSLGAEPASALGDKCVHHEPAGSGALPAFCLSVTCDPWRQ